MKFEIDKEIIDKTINCQHSFACLNGDLSHCGGIESNGDEILCVSGPGVVQEASVIIRYR